MENKIDTLFFTEPASEWNTSLPVGNGRLGAMVRGNPVCETIQINEESVWSGGPQDRNNPDAQKTLPEIRRLIASGNLQAAQELCYESLTGTPPTERVYQTAGEIHMDFYTPSNAGITGPLPDHSTPPDIHDYSRSLNMTEAVAMCRYKDGNNVEFVRRVFVSAPDDMIIIHITASEPGSVYFRTIIDRGIWSDRTYISDSVLVLEDAHGIPFCAGVAAVAKGGSLKTLGTCITVERADEAVLLVDVQTAFGLWNRLPQTEGGYRRLCLENTWTEKCRSRLLRQLETFTSNGFTETVTELYDRHVKEYRSWYDRMSFRISSNIDDSAGESNTNPREADRSIRPINIEENCTNTSKLLALASENSVVLVQQYCNFGRYLLISCSRRPGRLPATLQGLWNKDMDPPWGSKYTVNINTEMNYWPACMCGLAETEEPLFDLLDRAYPNGRTTAQVMYGCGGYVIHHNLDIWGDTAPQDSWLPGTYWTLGAAWLATHIREHFEYTLDIDFLERRYYLLHEACRFFVDFLIRTPDGYLILDPSVSPENTYRLPGGEKGSICAGCAMDSMILEHLFRSCLDSAALLGERAHDARGDRYETEEYEKFKEIIAHLVPPVIQRDGTLREWNTEVEETEPGHRHISHLYGLFPGHSISIEKTPELAEAACKTLEKRLANGGGHTGWSQAWILNFRASLRQGNEALKGLLKLFEKSTLPNLLDNHPPFQIDGNFGALTAVMRMLVQSELEQVGSRFTVIVRLLPALPDAWPAGNVRGIRIKGALSLDMEWKNKKPVHVTLHRMMKNTIHRESIHIRLLSDGKEREFDF